jgi:hypothetical protein
MGQKILKFYEFVDDELGLLGKIKLAQRTKIPSTLAASVPDSPENLELFMTEVKGVTGKVPQL